MKKIERIKNRIKADKDLLKRIDQAFYGDDKEEKITAFIDNSQRYIKAIKQNRVICVIDKVSKSGLSRTMKFHECANNNKHVALYGFSSFFHSMGYNVNFQTGLFRVSGCGMDMVFHTNYTVIHKLKRLGFISEKQCSTLAQNTPSLV